MTEDVVNLRSLVEKSADRNFLREMIGFTAENLTVGAKTGAGALARGIRSHVPQRNDYRDRN